VFRKSVATRTEPKFYVGTFLLVTLAALLTD